MAEKAQEKAAEAPKFGASPADAGDAEGAKSRQETPEPVVSDEKPFTVKTSKARVSVADGVFKDGDKVTAQAAETLRSIPSVEVAD